MIIYRSFSQLKNVDGLIFLNHISQTHYCRPIVLTRSLYLHMSHYAVKKSQELENIDLM